MRQELPQAVAGLVDGIAGGGRTEPVERLGRRMPAVLDRGAEPKQFLPTPADCAAGNGFGHDWPQDMRDFQPSRQVEPSCLEFRQTRAQVEPDELGERHREMREAVGVDRDALDPLDLLLPQGALDGGAGLAAVQDDRLIVENAPLIEHVGVGADGIGPPPGIEPRRPEIARRLEAHHVGRGKQSAPPKARDPVPAHEAQHRIIGGAQPSVRFDPDNHLSEAVGHQRGHHAHQFGGGEIGAEADETGIERHQFALRSGRPSEEGPGEAGQVVDFDDDFGKLNIADGERQRLSSGIDSRIPGRRLAPRQPQFAVLDGDSASPDGLGQGRKTGCQTSFQAPNIRFWCVRQVEPPDEAAARALPQGRGDQLFLGGTMRKTVIDRDRAVPQPSLEGHHGRRAKATERRRG